MERQRLDPGAGARRMTAPEVQAVLAALIILLSGCGSGEAVDRASSSDIPHTRSPDATWAANEPRPVPREFDTKALEPGTYTNDYKWHTTVPYSFMLPAGWIAENFGRTISKHPDQDHELSWNPFVIERIYRDACGASERQVVVGPSVDDLVDALRSQRGPAVSAPVRLMFGGIPAPVSTSPSRATSTSMDAGCR